MAQRINEERDLRNIYVKFEGKRYDNRASGIFHDHETDSDEGASRCTQLYSIEVSGYDRELSYDEVVRASGLKRQSAPFLITDIVQQVGRDQCGNVFQDHLPHYEG